MDPVTLVVAALVAGAAKGVGETAAVAVKDAYGALKSKLRTVFAGDAWAEKMLAEHEADPETYEAPLKKELQGAGVAELGEDDDLILAAQTVLAAADPAGARSGQYVIGPVSADRGGIAIGHNQGTVTSHYQSSEPAPRRSDKG